MRSFTFVFNAYFLLLAQLEVDIVKNLEHSDVIRFYDHYVSPRSMHRRKLAIHVKPSPLALQEPTNETTDVKGKENELESVPNQTNGPVELTTDTDHAEQEEKLVEQPNIVDNLVQSKANEAEAALHKKQLNLPTVELLKAFLFFVYPFFLDGMD